MNNDLKKSNAGAKPKPVEERKVTVTLYVKGKIIDENGGLEALKNNLYYFLGQK